MNHCCNIVKCIPGNTFQYNFVENITIIIQENESENVICKLPAILYRPECVPLYFQCALLCSCLFWQPPTFSSQVKHILLHNITSVHTLNTETEAHWGLFASAILAFVTISWPHWETKKRVSKGAICQCTIPCCGGRHHIITITWNGIISAIKLWYSTILASYLFVHEICSHSLFEKINGGGILNI